MPAPFNNQLMVDLQSMTLEDLKRYATAGMTNQVEITLGSKVAELAHFMVHNYRDELSPQEHVIDTAIRLLKNNKQ